MSYKIDFDNRGMARTLWPEDLGDNDSGWRIDGQVMEDYYRWVNEFEANHPEYGYFRGDYERNIEASSKEAYDDFYKNHPPNEWDYWDI